MSGGHFEYRQDYIDEIADEIQHIVDENNSKTPNVFGHSNGRYFRPEVVERLKEAVKSLRVAYIYARCVDWLLSDDDGEESFLQHLEEELKEVRA